MRDTVICPHIIWKVDLSNLSSISRYYCQSVNILKSHWRLVIEIDEEWQECKIYIMPETPEVYLAMRFFVQCGMRDVSGTPRFERSQITTTENLLTCCIWGASIKLLLDENLLHKNTLWFVCTVEPASSWEECQILTDKGTSASPSTSLPCTDDFITDFEYLLRHALHHDVILECENEIIKAHKSVLSCRSGMFEGMFRSNTKEALEGKVVIRGTPFRIFEKIIRYIYTTEIKFEDLEFACDVYVEADKYFIIPLKERCKIFFKTYLCAACPRDQLGSRVSDACRLLCLAYKHADISLQYWIEDYLADSALLVTSEWNSFAENNNDVAMKVYFKLLKNVEKGKSSIL